MSRLVLLTGPIASGKSTASRYLSSKGYPVYDCDSRAKALYKEVDGLLEQVEKMLGVSFEHFGEVVFRYPEKLAAVESVLLPHLLSDLKMWVNQNRNHPVLIVESATALSKIQFQGLFDEVILIKAPLKIRTSRDCRVPERDSLQSFDESKASFVIVNDSSISELNKKIDQIL